jgi:biotin operon repressor
VLARGGVLTGPQIAELTGYPYQATLKACLAALRRRGIIVNRAPGYALAEPADGPAG